MNITVFLIIVILIDVAGLALIVRWMYKDARARGINPWGWILLTCFLSPNFIGLITYLLVRPRDTEIHCLPCGKKISQPMNYCPWCGTANELKDKTLPPGPSYQLLIPGIIIMVVCTLVILTICLTQFT